MKRITIIGICFCVILAAFLYILVKYQTDLADADEPIDNKDVFQVLDKQKDLSTLAELIRKSGLHPILKKQVRLPSWRPLTKLLKN